MKTYKGTDSNMKCMDFQYEVGKGYSVDGEVELCANGFHACESPMNVMGFYAPGGSRYFEVEQSGKTKADEEKIASQQIKLTAEIGIIGLVKAHVNWVWSICKKIEKEGCAATTGEWANAATTGEGANAATTGHGANAATTGNRANAATTGNRANAATTGYWANAATTGEWANAATTGEGANAATTGYGANAATTGNRANAATTGYGANAATTGYGANAATTGENCIAAALGMGSRAKVESESSWIVITDWRWRDRRLYPNHVYAVRPGMKVQRKIIRTGVWYWFEDGKLKSEAERKAKEGENAPDHD